jgi:cytochrome c oxidase subunit 2
VNGAGILADARSWLPVFQPASPQAESIRHLFIVVLVLCALIFLSVAILVVWAAIRFRAKATDVSGRQTFGNRRLEIAWTVGPALVVFWLAMITVKLILTIQHIPKHTAEPGEPDIVIVGHQWWWEARYPKSGIVTANEIHLPVGKKFRARFESADVVHCFWAPQLGRKIDAIPGKENYLWLEPGRAGVFDGWCAEFCGNQHAWMKFLVVAEPPAEFDLWTAQHRRPMLPAGDDAARAGEKLFFSQTCSNCHSLRGADATSSATAAPDLTHLSSRRILAAGAIGNSPKNLARWLSDPESIKPGCKMPNFKLTNEQVTQLVAFLWRAAP